jgi:hypothetical protein
VCRVGPVQAPVSVSMAPERLRDHRRPVLGSDPTRSGRCRHGPPQHLERRRSPADELRSHLRVARRRVRAGVPEQHLHGAQIHSGLQQPRRVGPTQVVRRDPALQPSALRHLVESAAHRVRARRVRGPALARIHPPRRDETLGRKQPGRRRPLDYPVAAQHAQVLVAQLHRAGLGPLAAAHVEQTVPRITIRSRDCPCRGARGADPRERLRRWA